MSKKKEKEQEESRRGAVGGQAVIEGVMMKSKENIAIAVRRESGEIVKKLKPYKSAKDKHKILNIPVIRGFVNFIEMMAMSMSTLNDSAEMLGLNESIEQQAEEMTNKIFKDNQDQEDKESNANTENSEIKSEPDTTDKPESELKNKDIDTSKLMVIASIIGTVLGLALSFGLFFFLPTFVGRIITDITGFEKGGWFISITEGILRLAIFIIYILLVSLIKDIKRTFQYHGAEHMSVFCYEAEEELTVENVKKYSRFHPRCGTSFLIVMMIIGVVISMLIPDFTKSGFSDTAAFWLRLAVKLSVFPFIIGIGYEFIRFAGKHDNIIVKIVSAPGLWIQRLTTKKPDDLQLEVAVVSLRTSLKIDPVEEEPVVGDAALGVPSNIEPQTPVSGEAADTPFQIQKGADGENDEKIENV
ncbi:MAG: DUF1385 domain-containing protein [Oscillospiraceae bacterium]|nr:DUF1385 domain-containing protein [Oscillospiraceae bacterium]